MKTLVLLDFDGTMYKGDSLLDFARFLNPKKYRRSLFSIAWMLPFSWLRPSTRDRMKARFLKQNFAGIEQQELWDKGRIFHQNHKDNCFPKALNWLREVNRETHEIVLVSASCREWLEPFAVDWNVGLICTQLDYRDKRCTGEWIGSNLRGVEKVKRVRQEFDLSSYEKIIAYGNEPSDLAFKQIAQCVEINYFRA